MRLIRQFLFTGSFLVALLGCAGILPGAPSTPTSPAETSPTPPESAVTPTTVISATATTTNPTVTSTAAISDTASTPAPNPTPLPDIVVIEGPVENINLNIITISNTKVEVNINDPILTSIKLGDVLHLEGKPVIINNILIVKAINVVVVENNVIIIDNGAEPVPPGCKVTKKGHVKCSQKKTKKKTKK